MQSVAAGQQAYPGPMALMARRTIAVEATLLGARHLNVTAERVAVMPALGLRSTWGPQMARPGRSDHGTGPAITLGQLEADYPMYCKALRMLVKEGVSLTKIKRTLCWSRLEMLYVALPRQYRDPVMHYGMVKRVVDAEAAGSL